MDYLTAMTLQNTALTEGPAAAYIGINATRNSLTLDPSVRSLYHVAAYRITPECDAVAPTTLNIVMMTVLVVITPRPRLCDSDGMTVCNDEFGT